MVNFEWNQKDFEEAILEEGMERGRAEGVEQGKIVIILEMLRGKLPREMGAHMSKFPLERVKEIGRMHSLL